MENRWLSVDEITACLGIKRDTIYKRIADKQMPAHRLGRLWKSRKEEIDEWFRVGGAVENKQPSYKFFVLETNDEQKRNT
ncbi:MAG: excisionase family DNA-binding protein [Deltaproteobacteria bacterium]|nr:excisionase family DNA-binding protein [Deltaproteobacteria bacterium]